jgi:hypothetical protein
VNTDGTSAVDKGEAAEKPPLSFSTKAKGSTEMDLRQYYKKLHELESKMPEAHVLVLSLDTGDGGKEGVITEVPRRNACQLILEGRARRVDQTEEALFRMDEKEKREEFQRAKVASRVQVQLVNGEMLKPAPAERGK